MYLVNDEQGITQTIHSQHMALGVLEDHEFELNADNYPVTESERLIVFTDGIVETFNPEREMFGYERLMDLLNNPKVDNLDKIIEPLNDFRGDAERDDDISIFCLRCKAVGSAAEQEKISYSNLQHSYQLTLNCQQLKSSDPVIEIIDMISGIIGVEEHRSNLFLLLSEAYNNAVDHGILELDSSIKDSENGFLDYYLLREEKLANLERGQISIQVCYQPEQQAIIIEVQDSGKGFVTADKQPTQSDVDAEHGRGNLLLTELADKVEYNEAGNHITITYMLK